MNFATKLKFLLIQLFVLGYVGANVVYPLIVQKILDQLSTSDFSHLKILFLALLFATIVLIISSIGRDLTTKQYLNQVKQFYRERILRHVFKNNSENLSSEQEAEYLSVFNNDIPMVCNDHYNTILNIIYSCVTIAFSLFALVNINTSIACLIVLNFVALAAVPLLFKERLQKSKNQISDTLKRFNVKLKDSIFCIPVIKSYLAEKEILDQVNLSGKQANDADYQYTKIQTNANLASMMIGYTNDFLVLLIGVYLIIKGKITIGALLAVIQISNLLANPITTLSYHFNTVHSVQKIKQNLWNMAMQKPDKEESNKKVITNFHTMHLDNVTVTRDGRAILDKINLNLEVGKRYLIIGKNGSGKSTLLKVINRNIVPDKGQILMDDVLIENLTQTSFSKNILMDYQESYLFTAPIKENITLYQPYSEEKLREIGEALNISHLINDKDETRVHHLSGGEKQKIALARILLRQPAFFLLDEAFSAMDVDARKELEQFLLDKKYSLISISHTYTKEILQQYDEIILMKNGKVEQKGNLQKIIENNPQLLDLYQLTEA